MILDPKFPYGNNRKGFCRPEQEIRWTRNTEADFIKLENNLQIQFKTNLIFLEIFIFHHFASPAAVHHPAGRDECHSGEHRENLVSGRMDREDDNPPPCGPLTQVLDEEKSVEYVHASSGLV